MHKVNLSREFENKQINFFLKEILQDIPKKNRVMNKQECHITYETSEELSMIASSFSAVLTEMKIVDYMYDYCEYQQMKKEAIPQFVEAFFMVNSNFISYALILTKTNLLTYLQFNDKLDIEAFITFNMTNLNKDLDTLVTDPYVLESIYSITKSGVMGMIDVFKIIVEIEEKIKDIPKDAIKDLKIYDDNGLKCITESKVLIDEKYLREKFNIELDSEMIEVEKLFILIGLIKPSRVILFASVPEEIKTTLVNSGKTFEPALGSIKFFTANEPKPVN